jgi:hypothetical protein
VKTSTLFTVVLVSSAALVTGTAEAQGNWQPGDFGSARIRLGLFMPQGDSEYWQDTEQVFTGGVDDFEDLELGFDYLWRFSRGSGLMFSSSFYEGDTTRAYRDYVDEDGYDIRHVAQLDTFDMTAAWVFQFPTQPVRPYLGLGGGFLFWELTEEGYFIDFGDPGTPIVPAYYGDDGGTFEGLALAGIEIGMSPSFSFLLEGRYRFAEDELGSDFAGAGTIDLSGFEASAGFAWNF